MTKSYLLLKFAIENNGSLEAAEAQALDVCKMWAEKDCWADGWEKRTAKKATTSESEGRVKYHYEIWGCHSQEKIDALQARARERFQAKKDENVSPGGIILPSSSIKPGSF